MTERDWVPCHRRLLKGAKKGWPRAVRFILLELCHEARPTDGVLDFPVEWDTLTAVHDRLGGDRRELRKALTLFQIRDDSGQPVIEIERDALRHQLRIVKWETWSGPKSGAERMRTLRERELASRVPSQPAPRVTSTGSNRTVQERERPDVTPAPEEQGSSERRLKSVPPLAPEEPPEPPEAFTSDEAPSESGYALAERLWHELWQAKYRRPYEHTGKHLFGPQSEDAVLRRIGEKAVIRGIGAEAYLRHKISAYLRDKGDRDYLVEHCHPLRTLERDWVKYGEPQPPRRMVPRREEPAVELVSIDEMAARATAAMLAKVGTGGT